MTWHPDCCRIRMHLAHSILVVDDEPQVRHVMSLFLTKHGYRVLQASSGFEALDIDSRYHLLITDVTMPGMSGPELVRCLIESGKQVPVVYTSGFEEEDVIPEIPSPCPAGFLQKPFRPSALLDHVNQLLPPS